MIYTTNQLSQWTIQRGWMGGTCSTYVGEDQCMQASVGKVSGRRQLERMHVAMCFVWIWEQTAIISLYSINWLVCVTETECVYCVVRTGSLYIILRSAHTVYLCVLCGSENKQRLFPYTALTDWFYNWDGVCLLSGTSWIIMYNLGCT